MKRLLVLAVPLLAVAAPALATPGNGWSGPVVLNGEATVPGWYAAMDATAGGDAVAVWNASDGAAYVARRPSGGSWSAPASTPGLGAVSMVAARADGTTVVAGSPDGGGAGLEVVLPDDTVVPAPLGDGGDTAYAKVDPSDDGLVGAVVSPGRLDLGYARGGDAPGTWRSTTTLDVPHIASVTISAGDTYLVATDRRDADGTHVVVSSVDGMTGTVSTAADVPSPGPVVWFRISADPEGRAVLAWVWAGGGREHLSVRRLTPLEGGFSLGPATRLAGRAASPLDPIGQPLVLMGPEGRATVLWTTTARVPGHRVVRAATGGAGGRWSAPWVLDPDVTVQGDAPMQFTADTVPATGAALATYVDHEALVALHRDPGHGFAPAQRLFADYSRGTSSAYGVSAVAADGRAWVLKVAVDGLVKVRERPAG